MYTYKKPWYNYNLGRVVTQNLVPPVCPKVDGSWGILCTKGIYKEPIGGNLGRHK